MNLPKVCSLVSHVASSKSLPWSVLVPMILAGVGGIAGCYDGDALVQRASSTVIRATLAEVDLGSFHTTLPRDRNTASLTELRLHVFAAVPRYHVAKIEDQLQAQGFLVRHKMLAVVRNSTPDELAEPSLGKLRKRLEGVVNDILDDTPVKFVGFYEFAVRRT
jgi:hypothetical protein